MLTISLIFKKNANFAGGLTRDLLGLRMRKFRGIINNGSEHIGRFSNLH